MRPPRQREFHLRRVQSAIRGFGRGFVFPLVLVGGDETGFPPLAVVEFLHAGLAEQPVDRRAAVADPAEHVERRAAGLRVVDSTADAGEKQRRPLPAGFRVEI